MRTLFTILILLGFSGVLQASNITWEMSSTSYQEIGNTVSNMKVLHSKIEGTDIITSSTTMLRLLNPTDDVDLKKISDQWRNTYPNIEWIETTNNQSINMEGHWSEMNRYVYLKLIKLADDHFAMAVSFTRPIYKKELDKSIRSLQSYFVKLNRFEQNHIINKTTKKTSWLNFLISDAYAQGFPFPFPPGGLPPGLGGMLGPIIGPLNAINTNLSNINNNLANGVAQWTRTNDLVEQMLDTKTMARHGFLVGAATAAGAALGAWVTNLAIDGITEGIKFLAKHIFGFERRKLLWEDYRRARDNWPELDKIGIDLQKKMDYLLSVIATVTNLPPTDILKHSKENKVKLQVAKDTLEVRYQGLLQNPETTTAECKVYMKSWIEYLDENIERLDHFVEDFSNARVSGDQAMRSYFCEKLNEINRQLYSVNDLRNSSRIDLMGGGKEYFRVYRKQKRKERRKLKRVNSSWYQSRIKMLGGRVLAIIERSAMKRGRQGKKRFMSRCTNRESEVGKSIWESNRKKLFKSIKQKNRCRTAYNIYFAHQSGKELNDVFARSSEARGNMEALDRALKDQPLSPNSASSADQIVGTTKWYLDLQYEAKCVNQVENEEVAMACLKAFPGAMKPILAQRRGEQASQTLGCQNDYYQITQIIDGSSRDKEVAEELRKLGR